MTPVLATHQRDNDIHAAAMLLPQACRWRDALLMVAEQRYAEAAALYEQVGSHPLAADAHLLAAQKADAEGRFADASRHAEAILA